MVVMKILRQICMILFFLLLNNNENRVTIKMGKQCVTIHNLPNGYCKEKIRVIKGDNYSISLVSR